VASWRPEALAARGGATRGGPGARGQRHGQMRQADHAGGGAGRGRRARLRGSGELRDVGARSGRGKGRR
jgi:hypothetical protein